MSDDLRTQTLRWARQWWDADAHMVWNPARGLSRDLPERSLHMVPNSAWLAYAFLGEASERDRAEGVAAVERLLELQYDAVDQKFHGTFAQFLESPYPPPDAQMWVQYDPNWRQFVGTTFALILEDFADALPDALVARIEASISLACDGEAAEGRLTATYANPALMAAWLDGWLGRRVGDDERIARGERFARAVAAAHDEYGAFEEFNSPTYYGIDVYALRLWVTFPPTEYFAETGRRLESALWRHVVAGYHPGLRNSCGPYTRSYHPDATRSVTLMALWQWALFGAQHAPLPSLDDAAIDHGHDLMAGPVFARLAGLPRDVALDALVTFNGARDFEQRLANGRVVTGVVHEHLMLGAESSDHDWGGWAQFMPVTVHWREPDGVGVLWLTHARIVRAAARDDTVTLSDVDAELSFGVLAPSLRRTDDGFVAGCLRCRITGADVEMASPRRLVLTPTRATVSLEFAVS